jgi:uncharacterized protein (TIGR00369 family)
MTASALDRIPMPPSATLLGWRMIDHDAARGWVRIGFDGKPAFCNPAGYIQGGLLTAMLDDTMGPAVWIATDGQWFTASIDITVSFLNPAKPGPLVAEASVIQRGKTIAFLEGQLRDDAGTLVCRATSTARLVPAPRALG